VTEDFLPPSASPEAFDPADYVFKTDDQVSVTNVKGIDFNIIARDQAHWNSYVARRGDTVALGILNRVGRATIINPDPEAVIAFLEVAAFEDAGFIDGKFTWQLGAHGGSATGSTIALKVFPRDAAGFHPQAPLPLGFEVKVRKDVPGAVYIRDMNANYCPMAGAFVPHSEFVGRHVKNVAVWGLHIAKIIDRSTKMGSSGAALEELFSSELLSKDPSIRDAFKGLLAKLFRLDDPTPSVPGMPSRRALLGSASP
jgi:hypothetical protein